MDSAIVLAHDIHEMTVQNLASFMIDTAEREGFELVTLGACMNDPSQNWYRDPTTGGPWQGPSRAVTADSQSLQLKQRIGDDQTASDTSMYTASPTTAEDAASRTNTRDAQETSTSCASKDECVESDKEMKPTGTISEDDEDSSVANSVGSWGYALFSSIAVGFLVLS